MKTTMPKAFNSSETAALGVDHPPTARSRHWDGSASAARNRAKLSRASPQQPGRCTGVSHAWCPAAPPTTPQPPAPPLARGGTRPPGVRCMRMPLDAGAAERETAARARLGHKSTTIFVRRPSSNPHCIMVMMKRQHCDVPAAVFRHTKPSDGKTTKTSRH